MMPGKKSLTISVILSAVFVTPAFADYIGSIDPVTRQHKFSNFKIPENAGESTGWWDENGSAKITFEPSDTNGSYVELSVDGTLVGDNIYATDNPGIGIKYQISITANRGIDPASGSETAPNYRLNITNPTTNGNQLVTYLHVKYELVRLTAKVPAGNITSAPTVTINAYNSGGEGSPLISGIRYNAQVGGQPKITACTFNVPSEIILTPLYGSNIINGAQNVQNVEKMQLTNCPGAINGISYNFKATYGTQDSANGVLKTETGDGYAKNVYIQLQNMDGTGYNKLNTNIALDYDGSGDYDLPDFKIGYFINDANSVTAGRVKSALELDVTYN
ncbi:fimbrial protein [Salmonella enterica]|uniref:fimbrial protein n=1 Tax=Salmonella enterica TaxID=28901 RepID=UPI0012FD8E06|nr:fimbrial protein [Salmonella enterica]